MIRVIQTLTLSLTLSLTILLPAHPTSAQTLPEASPAPGELSSKQEYLAVAAAYFGHSAEEIAEYAKRYGTRDDLAVTLFVASKAGNAPETVHQLRLRGLFWWEISTMHELSGDVWFAETKTEEPEPRYRRSYEQLENWRRGRTRHLELTDDEVRDLIAVRVVHDVMNVPVKRAMKLRSSGAELREILAEERRLRARDAAGTAGVGPATTENPAHRDR